MPHPKRATYAAKYENQNFKYAFVVPNLFLLRHFLDDRNTHILGYSNQKQIDLLGDSGRRIQKIIERQLTAWR